MPEGIYCSEIYLNSKFFIQQNAFKHVVCEMATILSRPQCVNSTLDLNVLNVTFYAK